MARLANSVLFTPTLGGTTDWTVSAAVQGFMTPAQAAATDGLYKYRAESADLSQWEVGEGTYTGSGPTLTRTTILQNSLGTTAKVNFTTVPSVGIVALKQDLLQIEEASSWTQAQQVRGMANLGVPLALRGYIDGLITSAPGGSASLTINSGVATDSSALETLVNSVTLVKTTAAWAVGSAAGGLDFGTIAANTWYHVWLIKRPDTGVVDVLFSLSASAPTMPTNYTLKRLIWSAKTDGSSQWLAYTQVGDECHWANNFTELGSSAVVNTTANTLTLAGAPTGVITTALIHAAINPGASSNGVLITSLDENDIAVIGGTGSRNASLWAPSSGLFLAGDFLKRTNASAQIRWRAFAAAGDFSIYTYGFIHPRGKNA